MAPMTFTSTSQTYAANTRTFATWMAKEATACGKEIRPLVGADSRLPLSNFIDLAEAIMASKDPKVEVPGGILRTLEDLIAMRKEFSATMKSLNETPTSSQTFHEHFIYILEHVREVLSPSVQMPAPSQTQEKAGADLRAEILNAFALLTVEDSRASGTDTSLSQSKTVTAVDSAQEYDIERMKEDDVIAILCFLKDYREVSRVVIESWLHYSNGLLDSASAAVTTDTAYRIIEHSWQELMVALPNTTTCWEICKTFGYGEFNHTGQKMAFISTQVSQEFALLVEGVLRECSEVMNKKPLPSYDGKHGYYGCENPRARMSLGERQREDRVLLLEFLPEIARLSYSKFELPAQDHMTAGIKKMTDASDFEACPMYTVFATKLFLDIHHILRIQASDPFSELRFTAQRCVSTIKHFLKDSKSQGVPTWLPEDETRIQEIGRLAAMLGLENDAFEVKDEFQIPDGVTQIPPLFLERNPVYCGLLILRLKFLMQAAGLTVVNTSGSAIYPIHLYNACRQSRGLKSEWVDAEYLYQLHTNRRLFGGAPPEDPQDYLKRLLLIMGVSTNVFAEYRLHGGEISILTSKSKKRARALKMSSPVRDAFEGLYVKNGKAALGIYSLIALVRSASKALRTTYLEPPPEDYEALACEIDDKKAATPAQLLLCVRAGMLAEEMHLNLNYFNVHQMSIDLLRTVKAAVTEDIDHCFGQEFLRDESKLELVVGSIFDIIARGDLKAEKMQLPHHGNETLRKASDAIAAWLEPDDNSNFAITEARSVTRAAQYAFSIGRTDDLRGWVPRKAKAARKADA